MNKKQFLLTSMMLASVAVSLAMNTFTVSADTTTPVTTSNATSNASFNFKSVDGPTKPVDPNNPNNPGTNPGTNSSGSLTLDNVPDFNFGTLTISPSEVNQTLDQAVDNNNSKINGNQIPFVQITDKRGSGNGWTLSSSISDFKGGDTTIPGVTVTLGKKGNPQVGYDGISQDNQPNVFSADTLQLANSSKNLLQAQQNHGMGTWIQEFDASKTQIHVPASAVSIVKTNVQYNATITWTLADGTQGTIDGGSSAS